MPPDGVKFGPNEINSTIFVEVNASYPIYQNIKGLVIMVSDKNIFKNFIFNRY